MFAFLPLSPISLSSLPHLYTGIEILTALFFLRKRSWINILMRYVLQALCTLSLPFSKPSPSPSPYPGIAISVDFFFFFTGQVNLAVAFFFFFEQVCSTLCPSLLSPPLSHTPFSGNHNSNCLIIIFFVVVRKRCWTVFFNRYVIQVRLYHLLPLFLSSFSVTLPFS